MEVNWNDLEIFAVKRVAIRGIDETGSPYAKNKLMLIGL